MRWEQLFADLEAQAHAVAQHERATEAGELARAEVARLRLVDRLGPAVGTVVSVRCPGGVSITGVAVRVGPDWLLIDEQNGREVVVRLGAVLTVGGLGRTSSSPDRVDRVGARLGLASVLRGLARDRSPVRLHLVDATMVDGSLDRVGADFVEVAVHPAAEYRRRTDVREVQTVPHPAIAAVRRESPA